MRSNFAIRRSLTNVCSWDQMEWNVTGDVTIGTVDADEELCPRYTNNLNYYQHGYSKPPVPARPAAC